jgi:hypothetical protein
MHSVRSESLVPVALAILLFISLFIVPLSAATVTDPLPGLGRTAVVASNFGQARPPLRRPVVAIIDSGIARTAELQPLLVAEYDLASDPPRAAFRPRYDHGTMVGTILARAANRDVSIISLRIDDPAGCPPLSTPPCQPSPKPIERAIRLASQLGVDAINVSLSLAQDDGIVNAIRDAASLRIPVVLAAGNRGADHPDNLSMALAAYPEAVLVGALDASGRRWSGSNRPSLETRPYRYVWQLGVQVPTVSADGMRTIGTGTSFAVPVETAHVLAARSRLDRAGAARAAAGDHIAG